VRGAVQQRLWPDGGKRTKPRGALEQHLHSELASGTCTLSVEDIESLAMWAYEQAGLAHTLEGELPSPVDLVTRLGAVVRYGYPPCKSPAARSGDAIVVRPGLKASEAGLATAHEGTHVLAELAAPQHTHADVVAMTFCVLVPRATVRAALLAGELTPEGLTLYQPHAPLWALSLRIEMALVWLRDSAA